VISLFGSTWLPSRLWLHTSFHCELRCDYCAVASSPKAAPRTLTPQRFTALVDEAVAEGFTELYVTGGEPFLPPDIVDLPVVGGGYRPVEGGLDCQCPSGQGAEPLQAGAADEHRGTGSWARTVEGIRRLVELGLPPRVALTETPENAGEVPAVAELLEGLRVPAGNFAVRPMLRRGLSQAGLAIGEDSSIPGLTVTGDGLHWHPAGGDAATSPEMRLAGPGTSLAEGKRLVIERFFRARLVDGSLPQPVHCAI